MAGWTLDKWELKDGSVWDGTTKLYAQWARNNSNPAWLTCVVTPYNPVSGGFQLFENYYTVSQTPNLTRTLTNTDLINALNDQYLGPRLTPTQKVVYLFGRVTGSESPEGWTTFSDKILSISIVNTPPVKPTLSASTTIVNGLSSNYIQGCSKCQLSIAAQGKYNATITKYQVSGGGLNYSGTSNVVTSPILTQAGTVTFTITVTDSRGSTQTITKSITVQPYTPPRFASILTQRCDINGAPFSEGTYASASVIYTYSSVAGNAVVRELAYKESGTSDWIVDGDGFNSGESKIFGEGSFDITTSYDVRYTIADTFNTIVMHDVLSVAMPTIEFLKGGLGIAIGEECTSSGFFVNWVAVFRKAVTGLSLVLSGALSAASASISGALSAAAATFNALTVNGNATISGAITAATHTITSKPAGNTWLYGSTAGNISYASRTAYQVLKNDGSGNASFGGPGVGNARLTITFGAWSPGSGISGSTGKGTYVTNVPIAQHCTLQGALPNTSSTNDWTGIVVAAMVKGATYWEIVVQAETMGASTTRGVMLYWKYI